MRNEMVNVCQSPIDNNYLPITVMDHIYRGQEGAVTSADQFFQAVAALQLGKVETKVDHPNKAKNLNTANSYDFFISAGADPAFVGTILDQEGRWRPELTDRETDLYSLSIEELDQTLEAKFTPLYELAWYYLESLLDHGFNDHRIDHVKRQVKYTRQLLEASGASHEDMVLASIAGWSHDLGNLFSRKSHNFVSAMILEELYPKLQADPAKWDIIQNAILLHNEPTAMAVIESWRSEANKGREKYIDEVELSEIIRAKGHPVYWAIIAADKAEIGPHRLSAKSRKDWQTAAEKDPHLILNALGNFLKFDINLNQGEVSLHLDFAMHGLNRQGEQIIGDEYLVHSQRRETGRKVHVPSKYKENLANSPYFDTWSNQLQSQYADRLILTVRALFALYPQCQVVKFVMEDLETSASKTIAIPRATMEQHLVFFFAMHVPKKAETAQPTPVVAPATEELATVPEAVTPRFLSHYELFGTVAQAAGAGD